MLSLSSEAAPHLSWHALAAACRARGLDGEELVVTGDEAPEELAVAARAAGGRVVALRAPRLDEARASSLARASARLDVPISVPPGAIDARDLVRVTRAFARARGRLLLGHGTRLDEALATASAVRAADAPRVLGLAWELRPSSEDLREASAVLLAVRELLGAVRLHGGGPEQRAQDGRGVGPLLVELALSGYAGPVILCPSHSGELGRWSSWLSSTKSAGCGHAASSATVSLDIRDVEPRDRLETILGAYRGLASGARLELTLDHDPSCMYYTLEATEPEGSFAFEVVENGPEVWRARVTKQPARRR